MKRGGDCKVWRERKVEQVERGDGICVHVLGHSKKKIDWFDHNFLHCFLFILFCFFWWLAKIHSLPQVIDAYKQFTFLVWIHHKFTICAGIDHMHRWLRCKTGFVWFYVTNHIHISIPFSFCFHLQGILHAGTIPIHVLTLTLIIYWLTSFINEFLCFFFGAFYL